MRVAVTNTIVNEVRDIAPEQLKQYKQSWKSRISEVKRLVELINRAQAWPTDDDSHPHLLSQLTGLEEALRSYTGDWHRELIQEVCSLNSTVKINEPAALHKEVVRYGLERKRPFASKNSTADTLILLSLHRWALARPECPVHFYTHNKSDFSAGKNHSAPHPDIAGLFAPTTNITFHADISHIARTVGGLDAYDFYPRRDDGCLFCEETTPIEHISCRNCGNWPTSAPDHEDYTLKPYRDAFLVDVASDYGPSYRVACDQCGRKSFDVETAKLCSYHQHMSQKW